MALVQYNNSMPQRCALGIDFGTESVRLVLVDVASGRILEQESRNYRHGVLDRELPTGAKLSSDAAYQHPLDWLEQSSAASKALLRRTGKLKESIVGIGVDFTSCTLVPCRADGTPLCLVPHFRRSVMAWPKLWKHHGAKSQ